MKIQDVPWDELSTEKQAEFRTHCAGESVKVVEALCLTYEQMCTLIALTKKPNFKQRMRAHAKQLEFRHLVDSMDNVGKIQFAIHMLATGMHEKYGVLNFYLDTLVPPYKHQMAKDHAKKACMKTLHLMFKNEKGVAEFNKKFVELGMITSFDKNEEAVIKYLKTGLMPEGMTA